MKIKKLLKKAEAYISAEGRKRKSKKKFLKHVINELKKHEKSLEVLYGEEDDDSERERIGKEIKLVHAQRKKGLKNLKALKKGK
jgi:hypothetical protein